MESQAQLKRNHDHRQAEEPIRINHPEEEEHHEKGASKIVKKVKEKAKKIKKALTKHGHGHEHDRGEHIPDDHNLDDDGGPGRRVFRDSSSPERSSEKDERRGAGTLTPQNTPISLPSVPGGDQRRPRGLEKDPGEDDQLGLGRDLKMGNPGGFDSRDEEKVKETTELPFSPQGQDKGVSATEYLTEKLSPGEEDKALSEVVVEKLHVGGEKKGTVTQSEEVEKRLGGFSDQRSEEERKHGEAFAEEGEGGMVEKLRGAVTSWLSGTTEEVTQKSTESSSQSLASTLGNMGPGAERGDDNSGSLPLQKRFQ